MERLTARNNFVLDNAINAYEHTVESAFERCTLDFLKELRKYRDAEEQGLLLRLPCAEGTTVYIIDNNTDACADCRYFESGYCCEDYCGNKNVKDEDGHSYPSYPQYSDNPLCEKHFLEVVGRKSELDWIYRNRKIFGKSVFLTREEAEQALAEMQKG